MTSSPRRISRLEPAETTIVFDTYWKFAVERQNIFFRRLEGKSPDELSNDSIFKTYKFTNTYRASDRVSQYLIKNVLYGGPQSPEEIFFRTILFKVFNRIETWEMLEQHLGMINYAEYSFEQFDAVLTAAKEGGSRIYSGAYIMPSGSRTFGHSLKHRNNLELIELMMDDDVPSKLADAKSMQSAFDLLRSYPTLGDFLAYQYLIDLNYSNLLSFSENDFVVPGPGCSSGLRKCFSSFGGYTEANLIRLVMESQDEEFEKRGLKFKSLWGRKLQLIDCQNLFCEVDKYSRVAHPEYSGSGRSRIKQRYQPLEKPLDLFYPPKWKINSKLRSKP